MSGCASEYGRLICGRVLSRAMLTKQRVRRRALSMSRCAAIDLAEFDAAVAFAARITLSSSRRGVAAARGDKAAVDSWMLRHTEPVVPGRGLVLCRAERRGESGNAASPIVRSCAGQDLRTLGAGDCGLHSLHTTTFCRDPKQVRSARHGGGQTSGFTHTSLLHHRFLRSPLRSDDGCVTSELVNSIWMGGFFFPSTLPPACLGILGAWWPRRDDHPPTGFRSKSAMRPLNTPQKSKNTIHPPTGIAALRKQARPPIHRRLLVSSSPDTTTTTKKTPTTATETARPSGFWEA